MAVERRGLVSITGGKLTTYRVMAADVLRVVGRALGRPLAEGEREGSPLPGGDIDSYDALLAEISRETNDVAVGRASRAIVRQPLAAGLERDLVGRRRTRF